MSVIRNRAWAIPASLFTLFIFSNCSKSNSTDGSCEDTQAPAITTKTNIIAGTDLQLSAATVQYAQYYLWTGPNNFRSEEQEPVIENAQPINSGVYSVEVGVLGGCTVSSSSDSIAVSLPAAACNPTANTAHIDGVGSIQVYSATGASSGDTYVITANGNGGDVELVFPGSDRPTAGIYSIQPLSGQFLAGDVRLALVAQSSNWASSEGEVHLAFNSEGKFVATFCSIPVSAQTVVFNTTASGQLVED